MVRRGGRGYRPLCLATLPLPQVSMALNKISRIHEQALTFVYQNNLSFSELLDEGNSVTVYQKNLQVVLTKIYQIKNGLATVIIRDIYPLYDLRLFCAKFRRENIKTVHYSLQSVKYLTPKTWEFVPNNIKCCNSSSKFKKLIKS